MSAACSFGNSADLLQQVGRLRRRVAELEEQAVTDPLTGLLNRRGADAALRRILKRRGRGGRASLIMLDLDRFKALNDSLGHGAGDAALRAVGEAVRGALRETDAAARWGGEEVLVVVEDCLEGALATAERLRAAIRGLDLRAPEGTRFAVRASAGVAEVGAGGFEEALRAADGALYRAKALGRDRTEVSLGRPS